MRIVEWTDDLALGIEQIDDDHATLLKIAREIDGMLTNPQRQHDLHARMVRLFRFADEHFTREDTLMDQLPQDKYRNHIAAHRALHVAFLSRIATLSNRGPGEYRAGQQLADESVLTDLIVEMLSTDREMVDHLMAERLA